MTTTEPQALQREGRRFVGPEDAETKLPVAYTPWETQLYFTLDHPEMKAGAVTAGWIAHEQKENAEFGHLHITGDPIAYSISGPLTRDRRQRLGLIREAGVSEYKGEIVLELRNGPEDKSRITHFKEITDPGYRSPETIFVSVYTSADRLAWLRQELTQQPDHRLQIVVRCSPFMELHRYNFGSTFGATFYIEAENDHPEEKWCLISGATIDLIPPEPPEPDDDDFAPPPTRPAVAAQPRPVRLALYLGWVIALQIAILLAVLLRRYPLRWKTMADMRGSTPRGGRSRCAPPSTSRRAHQACGAAPHPPASGASGPEARRLGNRRGCEERLSPCGEHPQSILLVIGHPRRRARKRRG